MVIGSQYYRALESDGIASALSTALTIYPCQIRVHQRWQSRKKEWRPATADSSPRRLPVNTVIHTTLVGLEPTTFWLLVWRATDSPAIKFFVSQSEISIIITLRNSGLFLLISSWMKINTTKCFMSCDKIASPAHCLWKSQTQAGPFITQHSFLLNSSTFEALETSRTPSYYVCAVPVRLEVAARSRHEWWLVEGCLQCRCSQ